MIKILAISGSLRVGSFNTSLLRAAGEVAPEDVRIELYDGLRNIPPYDDDIRIIGYPSSVEDLRARINDADALLFATPEYNRSFPGTLKNAIDWASRPPDQPLLDKPAIVTGAGPGALGTALANYQLRQVLSIVGVHVLPGFELLVGQAAHKFDAAETLTDQETRDALALALGRLAIFARRHRMD